MATKAKRLLGSTLTTSTARPPAVEGRFKRVWGNTSECTHQWAANRYPFGECGNVSFRDGVLYSYAAPIARHVRLVDGSEGVFISTRKYSVTTSGHQSDARRAVPGRLNRFDVVNVMADTVEQHRENLAAIEREAVTEVEAAGRARKYHDSHMTAAAHLVANGNRYAEAVGIPDRLPEFDAAKVKEWKAAAAAKAEAARKEEERRNRKVIRERLREWEAELAEWRAGRGFIVLGTCPDRNHPLYDKTLLRVTRTDGGRPAVLETSRGARVPFAAALPVLAVVRGGDAPPERVGEFSFDGIDRERRTVTVGCHVVDFGEIERLAAELGL